MYFTFTISNVHHVLYDFSPVPKKTYIFMALYVFWVGNRDANSRWPNFVCSTGEGSETTFKSVPRIDGPMFRPLLKRLKWKIFPCIELLRRLPCTIPGVADFKVHRGEATKFDQICLSHPMMKTTQLTYPYRVKLAERACLSSTAFLRQNRTTLNLQNPANS